MYIILELLEKPEPHLYNSELPTGKKITLFQRVKYCDQIAKALAHIHGLGYLHGDLKLENLLYDRKTDSFKITDFGFSLNLDRNPYHKARGRRVNQRKSPSSL